MQLGSKAEEVFKKYSTQLIGMITVAGVENIVNSCWEKHLISTSVKNKLVEGLSRRTAKIRAMELLDTLRRSLTLDADTIIDEFLCIIYYKAGPKGQTICKEVAEKCKC